MLQNAAPHPTKCDVINDMKLFPTVFRRIYCRKFLALPNQKSRYKNKCIRISKFKKLLSFILQPSISHRYTETFSDKT